MANRIEHIVGVGLSRFVAIILLSGLVSLPQSAAQEHVDIPADHKPVSAATIEALKAGGHVIFFRHAATDHSKIDTDTVNLQNCATQRPLSDLGRRQSAAFGEAFRRIGIPVGAVLASPYCRCIDTAQLAFGRVTVSQDLVFALNTGRERSAALAAALRAMLATVPGPEGNTVISGHTANLIEATSLWIKPEGAAMIFRPDGRGGFAHVGTVMPDEWMALAKMR